MVTPANTHAPSFPCPFSAGKPRRRVRVRVTGSGATEGMPVLSVARQRGSSTAEGSQRKHVSPASRRTLLPLQSQLQGPPASSPSTYTHSRIRAPGCAPGQTRRPRPWAAHV
eukprot:364280-Chlamydomonas_euryale.AAC.19